MKGNAQSGKNEWRVGHRGKGIFSVDLQLNKHSDASYLPTYQDIFNARGDSYNEACRTFHGVRETERALLIDRLDVTPNQVCCDAPAGGGYLAEGLEKSHESHRGIICLEPAEKFLQGIPPRFDRVLGSLTAMPLASGGVDRIGSLAGLHHIEHKREVFHEAFRVLAPGGKMAVADVIEGTPVGWFLNEAVDRYSLTGHKGLFLRPQELTSLMAEAGFQEVSEKHECFTWDFPDLPSLVWYCKHLFGMVKADLAQVEHELRMRFAIDCLGTVVRLPWSLVYAVGTKPS